VLEYEAGWHTNAVLPIGNQVAGLRRLRANVAEAGIPEASPDDLRKPLEAGGRLVDTVLALVPGARGNSDFTPRVTGNRAVDPRSAVTRGVKCRGAVTLSDLARRQSVPQAQFVAATLEYPVNNARLAGSGWPGTLLLRPAAVGALGVLVAIALARALTQQGRRRLRRCPPA